MRKLTIAVSLWSLIATATGAATLVTGSNQVEARGRVVCYNYYDLRIRGYRRMCS